MDIQSEFDFVWIPSGQNHGTLVDFNGKTNCSWAPMSSNMRAEH